MKRRELLVAASASVAGFAGCSSPNSGPEDGESPASPPPLSGDACPPHEHYAGAAVCSHTVDRGSASVYLLPSRPSVDASTASFELTLHNESQTELAFNPYNWSVARKVSSGWERLEERSAGDGRLTVSPAETHTWRFSDVVEVIGHRTPLDAGTYAAGIDVPHPDGSDWIRCFALFRLT